MVGYYKVKAKKGLLVREGAALDTPEVTTLDNGLRITCEEEATVDGKVRLRLTSPVRGWASKKLMDFECKLGARPTGATPWLRKLAAPDGAEKRIVFFNWTGNRGGYGSSHNFKDWPKGLAGFECYEVQMTGRGARMKEKLRKEPAPLFDDVAAALDDALAGGPPCVFLGFSFGAIIAAEVGSRLRAAPLRLVVAVSCEGPAFPGRSATKMAALGDDAFEALLREKKGTEFILNGGEAMKKMYLPVVKADVALEEAYAPPAAPLLACPVLAYVGRKPGKDHEKTTVSEADAALWDGATTAGAKVHVFEDDWYVLLHEADVTKIIADVATFYYAAAPAAAAAPAYGDFAVAPLGGGGAVALSTYAARAHLIFNSASKCGMTPQLAGFQALQAKFGDRLQVLAFPCDQFKQEPGSPAEIAAFYADKFGVTFPLFAKGDVNGPDAHPLFAFLKEATKDQAAPVPPWNNKGQAATDVMWNFTKWLVVDGTPTKRYSYDVKPEAIEADIAAALN